MATTPPPNEITLTWPQLVKMAHARLRQLVPPESRETYTARLRYELAEVDKQGSNTYWLNLVTDRKRFTSNPNRLLLAWLLGMVQEDPIATAPADWVMMTTSRYQDVMAVLESTGKLPDGIIQDADKPDIDLDCLPDARDDIKDYAARKYGEETQGELDEAARGYGYVCSVGAWQTYLLRSAIIDVFKAMACGDKDVVLAVTTDLPDEVDELKDRGFSTCKNRVPAGEGKDKECGVVHDRATCPGCGSDSTETPTIGRLLRDYAVLREFTEKYPEVVKQALGVVGRIKTMSQHAGGLIIADRPLYGNIPLAMRQATNKHTGEKVTNWVSMWSEGRNTQLSKFGYNKWDILGLKNLEFIQACCRLVEQNRGISFGVNLEGWETIDPENDQAGWYIRDGKRYKIRLNDSEVLRLANQQSTDAVFQFDTELAKRNLGHGVRNFEDLMWLNAMGHPGPMDSIPEAMANRDDESGSWRQKLKQQDDELLAVLGDTYGTIVYQEQLQTLWQRIAGFTAPEAQEARKAVAKKWKHLLKPIQAKWVEGASRRLGQKLAEEWWDKMETFGRYAFNRCLDQVTYLRDTTTGVVRTVADWHDCGETPTTLAAWNGNEPVDDRCVAIHENEPQETFEVEFDDGTIERLTAGHRLLCCDGEYHTVAEIYDRGLDVLCPGAR